MPAPSALDIIVPLQDYIAQQPLTGFASFKCWVADADKVGQDSFYPNGKQDDANQPMNLYVITHGIRTTLPVGTEFSVLDVPYHAKATLRKGKFPEGAYQCTHILVNQDGTDKEYYVWTVYNGVGKKLLPAGFKTMIVPGKTVTCTLTLVNTGAGYKIENTECQDGPAPDVVGSATVVVENPAGDKLEDILVVLEDASGVRWQAVTQADGTVELHGLEPGDYTIVTAFDGWKPWP